MAVRNRCIKRIKKLGKRRTTNIIVVESNCDVHDENLKQAPID